MWGNVRFTWHYPFWILGKTEYGIKLLYKLNWPGKHIVCHQICKDAIDINDFTNVLMFLVNGGLRSPSYGCKHLISSKCASRLVKILYFTLSNHTCHSIPFLGRIWDISKSWRPSWILGKTEYGNKLLYKLNWPCKHVVCHKICKDAIDINDFTNVSRFSVNGGLRSPSHACKQLNSSKWVSWLVKILYFTISSHTCHLIPFFRTHLR